MLHGNDDRETEIIPFADLAADDWGLAYERVVGVVYELDGFHVEQRGLTLGLLDRGIDVLATNVEGHQAFIQCKSGNKKLGKQGVEKVLYSGGNFIFEHRRCPKPEHVLAAPNLDAIMSKQSRWHFLRHNPNEFGVKLVLREIPWPKV